MQKRDENRSTERRPRRTVLDPEAFARVCRASHERPSEDLVRFLSTAWMLDWTLAPHESYVQHVLPDPCVHVIVHANGVHVLGVVTKLFSTTLKDRQVVFGLKFRPGGFYPFFLKPVATFTNGSIPLADVFPDTDERMLQELTASAQRTAVMRLLEDAMRRRAPREDPLLEQVSRITDRIASDAAIHSVDQAARLFATTPRSLQRLFRTYIGASPKWLIRLNRIKEAAARIEDGDTRSWAELALRLGYADQAHFINDFRSLVGRSPARYAGAVRASARRRWPS